MGYRLTKIYTRTGDDGKTNLGDKNRISKHHPRIEALGTLDELNCTIGLMLSYHIIHHDIHTIFEQIQHQLFDLGGELCPPYREVIQAEHIKNLEAIIDRWNAELPPLREFLLPGGTPASAACHMARAVCRRAERCLVSLADNETINPQGLRFINRLSDVLFVAARILTKEMQHPETLWEHNTKPFS